MGDEIKIKRSPPPVQPLKSGPIADDDDDGIETTPPRRPSRPEPRQRPRSSGDDDDSDLSLDDDNTRPEPARRTRPRPASDDDDIDESRPRQRSGPIDDGSDDGNSTDEGSDAVKPRSNPASASSDGVSPKPQNIWTSKFTLSGSAGYEYGMPTPLSQEGHRFVGNVRFGVKSGRDATVYEYGVHASGGTTRFKYFPNSRDEGGGRNGTSFCIDAMFAKRKLSSNRLSIGTSYLFGFCQNCVPSQTRTLGGEEITIDSWKANAFHIGTRYEADYRLWKWLSLGGSFSMGAIEAKGTEMDQMLLSLGLFLRFNFDFGAQKQFTIDSKQKPSQLFFGMTLAEAAHKFIQGYFTGLINDNYERVMDTKILEGDPNPKDSLTNLAWLKHLSIAASMAGLSTSYGNFMKLEDWRKWTMPVFDTAAAAAYLAMNNAARGSTGIANLLSAARMLISLKMSNPSYMESLSEKERVSLARTTLAWSSALNLATGLIAAIALGAGASSKFLTAMLSGATTAQGSTAFITPPKAKTKTTITYGASYFIANGRKEADGWVGHVSLGTEFVGTKIGALITLYGPMLLGSNIAYELKANQPFEGTLRTSAVCSAVGYNPSWKHISLFLGPEQCVTQGGVNQKVGSVGVKARLLGKFHVSKKLEITLGASASTMWNVGNPSSDADSADKSKSSGSVSGMFGFEGGFRF